MLIWRASDSLTKNSSVPDLTSMSLAPEGTMAQPAAPFFIVRARSDSVSVTWLVRPEMSHWPLVCVTVTAGAPHWSRGSDCAETWETKKAAMAQRKMQGLDMALTEQTAKDGSRSNYPNKRSTRRWQKNKSCCRDESHSRINPP